MTLSKSFIIILSLLLCIGLFAKQVSLFANYDMVNFSDTSNLETNDYLDTDSQDFDEVATFSWPFIQHNKQSFISHFSPKLIYSQPHSPPLLKPPSL